ncbi:MAG: galactokinase family protein, partial [Clostridia bacterium]
MSYNKENLKKIYGDGKGLQEFDGRVAKLARVFENKFGISNSDIFSSPGRIEIVGNHTDHNHGQVLVGAIDCDMLGVTAKSSNVHICSEGYPDIIFDINDTILNENEKGGSKAMVKGVIQGFKNNGFKIGGFKMAMDSKIFKGAGVSSSAAYELLIAEILNFYYNGDALDRFKMAEIGQYAENIYFGKPCGLLDQSGISFGGIVNIDFENPKSPKVNPLGCDLLGLEVVIVNTGDHSNLTNEYADIKLEMNAVANFFGKSVLREVDKNEFFKNIKTLRENVSDRAILRAIHFYDENDRVQKAVDGIKNKDVSKLISAIEESGLSSQTNLQNAYKEGSRSQGISLAVAIAKENISHGTARVHGGGFAGTIIAFVSKAEKQEFANKMADIFGKENVFSATLRESGSCHLQ